MDSESPDQPVSAGPAEPTEPTEQPAPQYDEDYRKALGEKVNQKYEAWRQIRRPHELTWFITSAYLAGKHSSEALGTNLTTDLSKIAKQRKNIANRIWAKHRSRFAKFVRTRPKPIVIPFTHERKDRLNARMTERAFDYLYEHTNQEEKYADAILWAAKTFKAYWWYSWNPTKEVPIQKVEPITGTKSIVDVALGDIELEVGSGFEVLVPEVKLHRLGDQPEMMRVRVIDVETAQARYKDYASHIRADAHLGSAFEFERQIAHLTGAEAGALGAMSAESKGPQTGVLVKEHYTKPNTKFPKGRTVVVMNGFAVRIDDTLPFRFGDFENPYPCSEFADMPDTGRFYGTTFAEQLIPLQRGYNILRDKLETHIRRNAHPKWLVPKQARIPKGSLTNESGEVVEWTYIPGMAEPHPIVPGPISADVWRFAQLLRQEFDDISQLTPSFEGKTGAAKSGFQTNLLQEATDNVHSPDARGFELAIKDAAYKMRRMMKDGYDVQRLMSFSGRSAIPEVFEFSASNIDEHASIRVQIGSGLSTFKATRVQQLLDLYDKGLLGNQQDPDVRRRVLSLVDLGGVEEFQELSARDEDMARMENIDILEGRDVPIPQFYENHMVHYTEHTEELKNPANKTLDPNIRRRLTGHALLHLTWFNPVAAFNLAQKYGYDDLIQAGLITPPQQMQQTPGQAQSGQPPSQSSQPPQAASQGAAH